MPCVRRRPKAWRGGCVGPGTSGTPPPWRPPICRWHRTRAADRGQMGWGPCWLTAVAPGPSPAWAAAPGHPGGLRGCRPDHTLAPDPRSPPATADWGVYGMRLGTEWGFRPLPSPWRRTRASSTRRVRCPSPPKHHPAQSAARFQRGLEQFHRQLHSPPSVDAGMAASQTPLPALPEGLCVSVHAP